MAVFEHEGILTYKEESGDKHLMYPVTKAALIDGLDELLKTLAAVAHKHNAEDINEGTLASARLPTRPLSKGGHGQTTAAKGLYALINGAAALAASGLATGDYLALGDVSASTGKKVTLANLMAYLGDNMGSARIATGSYVGTGTYGSANPCSLTFDFPPRVVFFFDSKGAVVILQRSAGSVSYGYIVYLDAIGEDVTTIFQTDRGGWFLAMSKSADGKNISWFGDSQYHQCNGKNEKYFYMAIS